MRKRVVVIGAGLAGTLLCNELAKDHDVTLLEKGSRDAVQFPEVKYDRKRLADVPTFCFGRGGTTNLWHNGLIPLNTSDILSRDFKEVLNEALPCMNQAARALFFKNGSFLTEYEKLISEIQNLSIKFKAFPHGLDCLIYPKKYKRLEAGPRVSSVYSATRLSFHFENGWVKEVGYSEGRHRFKIGTDYLVVSAGAMNTPDVIQNILSQCGAFAGSAGLGFIDHPMGFVGKVKFKKDVADAIKKLSLYDKGEFISRNAVRLKSGCGRYAACVFFRPAMTMSNNLSIYKYKSSLGANKGAARLKNIFSFKLLHPDILAEIFVHIFNINIPGRIYNILFIAEQKRGSNRVYHDGDGLKLDWQISGEEITIYRNMLSEFKGMLTELADDINIEIGINDDWLWSAAHHSGTVSMGPSQCDLVDKDLRLKPCENVFVCDGSVIQEHSYANTGLIIGQLAFRLAKRIRDDIQG